MDMEMTSQDTLAAASLVAIDVKTHREEDPSP